MDKKKLTTILIVCVIVIACVIGIVFMSNNKGEQKTSSGTGTSQEKQESVKEPIAVNIGEKITTSDIEMAIASVDFKDKIEWKVSEWSTYSASIEDGKTGLSMSGTFKNLRGEAISDSNIIGKVVIDDKYTYDLRLSFHNSGYSVDPLESVEYDFYAQVPQEIKDTYSKAVFTFGYNNDFGIITTTWVNGKQEDKFQKLDNLYSVTVTK